MFKFLQKLVGTTPKPNITSKEEDIVLGNFCPLPQKSSVFIEKRARPRLVQHTPNMQSDRKFFMNDGDGYYNIHDPKERITYEEALTLDPMPIIEPDAVKEVVPTTSLPKWEQRRTGMMPVFNC